MNAPMVEIEVAEYGPSATAMFGYEYFSGPLLEDHGDELSWSDRVRTTVRVSPDASVAHVIDAAAEEFGIGLGSYITGRNKTVSSVIGGVAFYKSADDDPQVGPGPWLDTIRTVDSNGRLHWQSIAEARIGDLVRAFEKGVLGGDPRRIYLWPIVPQGDAGLLFDTWKILSEGFKYAKIVADDIAPFYLASDVLRRISKRLKAGTELDAKSLDDMKVSPWRIENVFVIRPLTTDEMQRFFGVTEEGAISIAEALGFEMNESGVWKRGVDRDARFVNRLGDFFIGKQAERPHNRKLVKQFVRERLEAQIKNEEESAITWYEEWDKVVNGLEDTKRLKALRRWWRAFREKRRLRRVYRRIRQSNSH
jgi:hypothetical protein